MLSRLLFLLSCVVCLVSCTGGGAASDEVDPSIIQNPNTAEGYDNTVAMPKITFDTYQHDFGRLTTNESIAYSFHFRNTGNADLVISRCEASCGCTVADYPRRSVKPGEEGYVTITFSSAGKTGQQVQEVTVLSNAQPARTKLRIIAQVGRN